MIRDAATPELPEIPECLHLLSNLLTIVCCAAEELAHHNPGNRDLSVIACAGREAVDVLERCRNAAATGNVAGSVAATTWQPAAIGQGVK